MSATKKGIIGGIVGAILTPLVMLIVWMSEPGASPGVLMILGMIPAGAFFGFGYAFGFSGGKRLLANFCGVAGTVSIFAILFSRDRSRSFLISFLVFFLGISFILGLCYLPGIFIGIRAIVREQRHQLA